MYWRVNLHMHVPLHHIVTSSWNNRFIIFLDFASSRLKSIHRKESSDFLRRKNIKTGTKSKVLRPVDKTTVMSSKSKSYRYLVLVKFV